jgi:hypothetical protein
MISRIRNVQGYIFWVGFQGRYRVKLKNLKNIIYIGETTKRTLCWRWNKFDKAAFSNGKGHSGGSTYKRTYKNDKREKLFVSASADNSKGEETGTVYIKYLERKLIWEYAKNNGKVPRCNKE